MGKSSEQMFCKLGKSEILRLFSIVHVDMETTKTSNFTCHSNRSSVYCSLAKFQLVGCSLSLAMIWQMIYTHNANCQNCVQPPQRVCVINYTSLFA